LSLLQSKAGFDVIVVGSGMGGGTLADALADAGVNTLLLEAGSLLFPSNVADLPGPNDVFAVKALENLEGSELTRDVCINFGGCSVFWTGLVPRMATWELSRWPDEIADYLTRGGYDDAERTIRKQTEFNAFQQQLRSELEAALPDYEVGFLPRSFHQPTSRLSARAGNPDERPTGVYSTAALLIDCLTMNGRNGRGTLFVALNTLVDRVVVHRRRVEGVEAHDLLTGAPCQFSARSVVLAAGATQSPCIALRSGVEDTSKRIGIGLTDHQQAECEYKLPREGRVGPHDQAKFLVRPKLLDDDHRFTCEILTNPQYWDVRHEDDDVYDQRYRSDDVSGKVKFRFGRELDDRNHVRLGQGELPVVYVGSMPERPCERQATLLTKTVKSFFGSDAGSDPELEYKSYSETYHAGGSLRIGPAGRGVLSNDLRFHEYDNLFCCDLSYFPYIPAANPSLVIVALARRLARRLSVDLGESA
jgi:choline dehydrogenase-like flavoprotein